MKKINFTEQVLPHIVAIAIFVFVTLLFFNPVFFEGKTLRQGDIQQWSGSSKELRDFRDQTGEEGLWASMFSGMPAYLVNVQWGYTPVRYVKNIATLFLPHPIENIYLAFLSYYIMLLAFRVRPYLAIAGAIAFGLSTYMIIGLAAGHSGRIGAVALMPLVVAGVHVIFSGKRILGFGLTALAVSLQLIENHLQITYYLLIILAIYMVVQFIYFFREKQLSAYLKSAGLIALAAILGIATFIGPLWGITEYTAYSIRGKSELASSTAAPVDGLSKTYAFEHSNGILEPMATLIPDFYGGSKYLISDPDGKVYQELRQLQDPNQANQIANQAYAYWGPQSITLDYYAGAIVVFLFAVGIAFADRKYIWWLVPAGVLSIMLSWGTNFEAFNYFLFDHLPGYNKFRSVTFAIIIFFFTLPLLGMVGLEKLIEKGIDKAAKKKILIAFAATGGICLLLILFAGAFSFTNANEAGYPDWFKNALAEDRESLMRNDAWRSLGFITVIFIALYFDIRTKISAALFYGLLIVLVTIDLAVVNKRSLTEDNFMRPRDNTFEQPTVADQQILQDKSYYRVYNLDNPMNDARTSYFHHSIGGYHGAKMMRYKELFDSCIVRETQSLFKDAQTGKVNFRKYNVIDMLNVKYLVSGDRVLPNTAANGPAWFVLGLMPANSATEELKKTSQIDTHITAVIDQTKFKVANFTYDSTYSITITEHKPNYLKYESNTTGNGFAVFSEIYYPKGWKAFIDGKEADIIRVNYVLRGLEIPGGKHTIEFKFVPEAYTIGNTITRASSWVVLLLFLGSLGFSLRRKDD